MFWGNSVKEKRVRIFSASMHKSFIPFPLLLNGKPVIFYAYYKVVVSPTTGCSKVFISCFGILKKFSPYYSRSKVLVNIPSVLQAQLDFNDF